MKEIYICGRAKCCPKLVKEKNYWKIIDDFGGSVKMTKTQLQQLADTIDTKV